MPYCNYAPKMLKSVREVYNMKTLKKVAAKAAKASAVRELRRNANSTTCGAFYQPKAPAALAQFKKSAK